MLETRYTRSGVRMRRHSSRPGELNWLLLPGGPGIGSESLHELAAAMDVPGSIWLVDLPGDGSNTVHSPDDPFRAWPHVLVEAAKAVPNAIFAGHSTGGMYLLATPAVREHISGLVLLDTAPDCDTPNVLAREVPGAGHFPWIENPSAVTDAFRDFSTRLSRKADERG